VQLTGYTLDGGYAEYAVADARYCFPLPDAYTDAEAALLLCAGLIGYRALVAVGDAKRIGIYERCSGISPFHPLGRTQRTLHREAHPPRW